MIEDLGLARLGLWNQRIVQNIENILTDSLQLSLDLLAVVADGSNMLIGPFRLLFLLDRRDYAPRSTSCTNDIFVGNRKEITLIDS